MEEEGICFLRDKELLEANETTFTRGLDIIRKSIVQGGDRIAERLNGLSPINVHTICCKSYTQRSIAIFIWTYYVDIYKFVTCSMNIL